MLLSHYVRSFHGVTLTSTCDVETGTWLRATAAQPRGNSLTLCAASFAWDGEYSPAGAAGLQNTARSHTATRLLSAAAKTHYWTACRLTRQANALSFVSERPSSVDIRRIELMNSTGKPRAQGAPPAINVRLCRNLPNADWRTAKQAAPPQRRRRIARRDRGSASALP